MQFCDGHEGDCVVDHLQKITYCKQFRLFVSVLLCLVQLDECTEQPEGTTVGDSGEQL